MQTFGNGKHGRSVQTLFFNPSESNPTLLGCMPIQRTVFKTGFTRWFSFLIIRTAGYPDYFLDKRYIIWHAGHRNWLEKQLSPSSRFRGTCKNDRTLKWSRSWIRVYQHVFRKFSLCKRTISSSRNTRGRLNIIFLVLLWSWTVYLWL